LIEAKPTGNFCHKGTKTCFGEKEGDNYQFLAYLYDFD